MQELHYYLQLNLYLIVTVTQGFLSFLSMIFASVQSTHLT
jgi:hypothetical protein